MNSVGRLLRFHILGESHGEGIGVVIDGLPPGLPVDLAFMQSRLDRRRPGQSRHTTPRKEADKPKILTGVFKGRATGAPLTLWIENGDVKSKHYDAIRAVPRPGHADYPAYVRSGGYGDPRGGGHFSGRLTAGLVAAGALAEMLLAPLGIEVGAHLHQVNTLAGVRGKWSANAMNDCVDSNPFKTAHLEHVEAFTSLVDGARAQKDSLGGVVEFRAEGMPVGVGEPWADSVESSLAHLLFAVPAVKGVSFGAGFEAVQMRGSEHNDPWEHGEEGQVRPRTNHAGGILGGLTTGAPVWGHVAIKPTSSIFQPQDSVDLTSGQPATLALKGRHDPLIAIRAVPVVQAAVAFVLADLVLCRRATEGLGG